MSEAIRRIGVMATRGRPDVIADAERRVEEAAAAAGIEVASADEDGLDLLVVLGGDGTMLRALRAKLGTGTAVFGINFGRVGFLTTAGGDQLDEALAHALSGDFRVVDLCSLEARLNGDTHAAVNDVVVTSSAPGRMVALGWEVAGERLADQPCDGMICCTPSGSTAYNLSNGGPVMMWGLEAMAMTFVAPHSLRARALVVPRGLDVRVTNRSKELPVTVLLDGHPVADLERGDDIQVAVGSEHSRLAVSARRDVLHPLPRGLPLDAASPAHRELRAHPRSRPRLRARPERDHGRDRGGEDDLRPGGRASARCSGRCRLSRPRGRGGLRGGGARPARRNPRRPGARSRRRAAAGRGGGARRRAPRVRRRAHARLCVGTRRAAGGPRRPRRAPARDVRPVRAAPARPSLAPARRARRVRRRGAAAPPGRSSARVARAGGRAPPPRGARRGSGRARPAPRRARGARRPHRGHGGGRRGTASGGA